MELINIPENQNLASSRNRSSIYRGAFFIGLVFLVLIFTLNYFNILPLSALFPNQLSWLPHKEKAQIPTPPPQIPISITPTGYIRFPYDTTKAEKILKDYITDNIKETFIPSNIEVKQNLIATGELRGTDYQFGANWISEDTTFHAALHYVKNANDLRDAEIFITPKNIKGIIVDLTSSAELVKTYFKNLPEPLNFDCGVFENTTKFCEHFTINFLGKSGFGIVQGKDDNDDILFIFSCFFPKNDSYYTRRTSCLLFRENDPTGL